MALLPTIVWVLLHTHVLSCTQSNFYQAPHHDSYLLHLKSVCTPHSHTIDLSISRDLSVLAPSGHGSITIIVWPLPAHHFMALSGAIVKHQNAHSRQHYTTFYSQIFTCTPIPWLYNLLEPNITPHTWLCHTVYSDYYKHIPHGSITLKGL